MDRETVKKVAEIARLHLEEEELERMSKDLESILEHFAAIRDIKAEKEMHYVHDTQNALREDKGAKKDGGEIRSQFTAKEDGNLSAPKLIK
jgi:aspartyl/glutamyl-tRNA(Asn/Gln) amidotransferase C subunit